MFKFTILVEVAEIKLLNDIGLVNEELMDNIDKHFVNLLTLFPALTLVCFCVCAFFF